MTKLNYDALRHDEVLQTAWDHRRRIRARPAIEQLHHVHLSVVDTYSLLPTFKPGTNGRLLARAEWGMLTERRNLGQVIFDRAQDTRRAAPLRKK